MNMIELAKKRRSCYQLKGRISLTDEQLVFLVQQAIKYAPSAFNSQSSRALILLQEKHHLFWDLVRQELRRIIPEERFPTTEEKIQSFEEGYGTILFFEEWNTVEDLQKQFPAYKDNFPVWAYQANAMAEYLVWTALAEQGIGASLQHYNPLVDEAVKKAFNIPGSWKLIAQMPFGASTGVIPEKTFLSIKERVLLLC